MLCKKCLNVKILEYQCVLLCHPVKHALCKGRATSRAYMCKTLACMCACLLVPLHLSRTCVVCVSDSPCRSVTRHLEFDTKHVLHDFSRLKSMTLKMLNIQTQGDILLFHILIMHNSIRCVRLMCVFYHIINNKCCVHLTMNVLRTRKMHSQSCTYQTHRPDNVHSHLI